MDVYDAFLDFAWKKGGGLPVLCLIQKDVPSKRTLFLFGDEVLLERTKDDDSSISSETATIVQEYKLEGLGPIWKSEIVPDSHLGTVSFSSICEDDGFSGTELTWEVSFQTQNRKNLWQSVTKSSITDACENLVAYVSEPRLMTKSMTIDSNFTPNVMANEWIDFVWRKGGGLPIPLPPLALTKNGYDRLIVPPFLREQILEVKETPAYTDIMYTVVNPSLITFPVFQHLGRLRFRSTTDFDGSSGDDTDPMGAIEIIWEVSVQPYNKCQAFVMVFTEAVINKLSRNFKCHIEDTGPKNSMVKIYPPRGFMKERGHLLEVRKDTWLGSVLHAHLKDKRSVLEQTKDLFMPWRWGANEEVDGTLVWSAGEIVHGE